MKFTENDGVLLPKGVRAILAVTAIIAVVVLSFAVVKGIKNRESIRTETSTQSQQTSEKKTTLPSSTTSEPSSSTKNEEPETMSQETKLKTFVAGLSNEYIKTNTENVFRGYATYAQKNFADYPDYLIEFVGKYPHNLAFALAYPDEYGKEHDVDMSDFTDLSQVPLFLQADKRWGYLDYGSKVVGVAGCGPTCLSMVAYYLTNGSSSMTPDKIVKFSIDNGYCSAGTPWTFFSQGAKKLGLNPKELTLDETKIASELEQNHPIVCNVKEGIFTTSGHYIVLRKYEDGKIYVNDPNSAENSSRGYAFSEIKDQIRNLWSFSK